MAEGKGCYSGTLVAGDAGVGSMLTLANPEGADLIITRFMILKTTGAGGAFTVDAGVTADPAVSSDTLLDGQSLVAAGLLDNITNQANSGLEAVLWPSTSFVVATPSGDISATGFEGTYYIEYVRV
jgi:hypothetical protein